MRLMRITLLLLMGYLCLLHTPLMAQPGVEQQPIAEETDIPRLLDYLTAKKLEVRLEAAGRLHQLGDARGDMALIAMIKGKEVDARIQAVQILLSLKDHASHASLLTLLQDRDPATRVEAVLALAEFQDPLVLDALLDLLKNPDPVLRERAVPLADKYHHPRAIEALFPLLRDRIASVRLATVNALEQQPDLARIAYAFIPLATDANADVRTAALSALGDLAWRNRDPALQIRLIDALLVGVKDQEAADRVAALHGFSLVADPRVVPLALPALRETDMKVRVAAIKALAAQHDASVATPIYLLSSDPAPEVRAAVVFALEKLDDPRVPDVLVAALADADAGVRRAAFAASISLASRNNRHFADRLVELLKSKNIETRNDAFNFLGAMRDPRVIEPALALMQEPDGRSLGITILKQFPTAATEAVLHAMAPEGDKAIISPLISGWVVPGADARVYTGLLALSADEKPSVRSMAMSLLSHYHDPRSMDALIRGLQDKDKNVRACASDPIQQLFDSGIQPTVVQQEHITALLADPDADTRVMALHILSQTGKQAHISRMLALLHDPSDHVQRAAIMEVARLQSRVGIIDDRVMTALLAMRTEPKLRGAVLEYLTEFAGDRRATNVLYAIAREGTEAERAIAVKVLLNANDPNSVKLLQTMLQSINPKEQADWLVHNINANAGMSDFLHGLLTQPDKNICKWAIEQMVITGDASVAEPLVSQARDLAIGYEPEDIFQESKSETVIKPAEQMKELIAIGDLVQHLGQPAVSPAINLLNDPRHGVQAVALWLLGLLQDTRAVPAFMTALKSTDPTTRCLAAWGLGQTEDLRAQAPLIDALHDPCSDVRSQAADALENIRDARALPALLTLMRDPDERIRVTVAHALGQFGDARVIPSLLTLASDPSDWVRATTMEAMGNLHDARTCDALLAGLQETDWRVMVNAAVALGKLRDPKAIEPLLRIARRHPFSGISFEGEWGNHLEENAAIFSLGEMGEPCIFDPLIEQICSGPSGYNIQLAVAHYPLQKVMDALSSVDALDFDNSSAPHFLPELDSRIIPPLVEALHQPNVVKQRRAAQLLAAQLWQSHKADAATRDALFALIRTDDQLLAEAAFSGLMAVNDSRVILPLIAWLRDENANTDYPYLNGFIFNRDLMHRPDDPRLFMPLIKKTMSEKMTTYTQRYEFFTLISIAGKHSAAAEVREAVPDLIRLLQSTSANLHDDAIELLGYIDDPRVVPALLPWLTEDRPHHHQVAQALAMHGDRHALAPVLAWLQDANEVYYERRRAASLLARYHDPRVTDALIVALNDPGFYNPSTWQNPGSIRESAAISLGEIGDRRAVQALIAALDTGYLPGRTRAAEALGKLKDPRAIPPLIDAISHFTGDARLTAATALKQLTGQDFGPDADRWQAWWEKEKKKIAPVPKSTVMYHE